MKLIKPRSPVATATYYQQLERESNLNQTHPNEKSKRIRWVRCVILTAIASIVAVKMYMLIFGFVDMIVGIYEIIVVSNVLIPFFAAYMRYKDPSKLQNYAAVSDNSKSDKATIYKTSGEDGGSTSSSGNNSAVGEGVHIPLASIVIPVFNESRLLREVVTACLESTYSRTEVILVNDGSTDGSGKVIDLVQREFPMGRVRALHLPANLGKRRAILEGIIQGKALGEVIVLIDSDSVVDKFAIEKLVLALSDPDIGTVTGHGRVLNANENLLTRMQDTWYDGQFSVMKGMESTFGSVTCCSGILSAYRREAIMPCLYAWCNETFLGAPFDSGDDRQLTSYVLGGTNHYIDKEHKIWKVKYCQSAVVHTDVPSSYRRFFKQQVRWKKSWIRAFFFTLPFYYKNRSPFAVSAYYLQVLISLIAPFIALRSLVLLPLEGMYLTALSFVAGLLFIDLLFSIEYRLRNPHLGNRWGYRLLLSFLTVPILDWLIYYSILTIKNNSWMTRTNAEQANEKMDSKIELT